MRIKLGVIFGGMSVEHEVSVISGIQAIESMDSNKYEIVPIYIDKNGDWYTGNMLKDIKIYSDKDLLKRYAKLVTLVKRNNRFILMTKNTIFNREVKELDIVFPVMHGTYGEDGALQGYLETIGIPFCECDHYAATVGQDKVFMKSIWRDNDVPVVKYDWFYDAEYNKDPDSIIKRLEKIGYPLIVKPARLGSSVGIKVSHNEQELRDAIMDAINYDNKILVEEVIQNLTEVNISVFGNYHKPKLSVIEEVGGSKDLLSYEDKYIGGTKGGPSKGMASAKRIIPANISEELANKVREIAVKAFTSLGSSGVTRIDFLIDNKTKKVYANEINSIPGSLAFYLWDKQGKDYTRLLDDVINVAIRDYKDKQAKTTTFDSNILVNYGNNKGVKGAKGTKGVK